MYMYLANYFNTLRKEIAYDDSNVERKCKCCHLTGSIIQAIFNYPFEWMNLFCCWCKNPKECIKDMDYNYCKCEPWIAKCLQVLLYLISCTVYVFIWLICLIFGTYFKSSDDDSN